MFKTQEWEIVESGKVTPCHNNKEKKYKLPVQSIVHHGFEIISKSKGCHGITTKSINTNTDCCFLTLNTFTSVASNTHFLHTLVNLHTPQTHTHTQ